MLAKYVHEKDIERLLLKWIFDSGDDSSINHSLPVNLRAAEALSPSEP